MRKRFTSQTKLYKKQFHERVTEIRRKGKLAKYKPRVKDETLQAIKKRRKQGRPPFFFPQDRESKDFKLIQKYFIEPLVRLQDWAENMSIKDRLDIIFNVHTRDIVPAIVTEDLIMPGLVLDTERLVKFRPPINVENKFPKGTPIFVRLDDTMPDRIDIENCETPDLMFSLTRAEYKSIIDKIEELDGCDYRLDPPGEVRNEDGSFTDLT